MYDRICVSRRILIASFIGNHTFTLFRILSNSDCIRIWQDTKKSGKVGLIWFALYGWFESCCMADFSRAYSLISVALNGWFESRFMLVSVVSCLFRDFVNFTLVPHNLTTTVLQSYPDLFVSWLCAVAVHHKAHCNTLPHTQTRCNTLVANTERPCRVVFIEPRTKAHCDISTTLQHTATRCNMLQHTATYSTTLQHTATHGNTLQHTATYSTTLQQTATDCNTQQYTATHCDTQHHTATRASWENNGVDNDVSNWATNKRTLQRTTPCYNIWVTNKNGRVCLVVEC